MFQLYKKRDFSQLIGDTFSFFKLEGKNYFKSYFIINGGILLLLVVILYFFMKAFIDGTFAATQTGNSNYINDMMYSNMTNFVLFGIFFVILISLASIINYSYPILYFKLIEEEKERTTEAIFSLLKQKFGKAIIFYLLSLVVIFPLLLIVFGITFFLIFILIGIPIIIILVPAVTSWITLTYYQYITSEDDYFKAIGKAFEMVKAKFWPIIGSTVIIFVIMQVVMGVITMIPYFIGIASIMTNPQNIEADPNGYVSTITILMTTIFILSIILNYVMQNLLLVNQGIIFYSIKETEGNISIRNDIDSIGTHEE
jgi:hypothetical protein